MKRPTERTQVKGQKAKAKAQNGADSGKRTAGCGAAIVQQVVAQLLGTYGWPPLG